MKISFPAKITNTPKQNQNKVSKSPFISYSLPFDTVSFSAMKKTEFKGLDLVVVNKFKAPVEKFDNKKDFDIWCKNEIKNIKEKQYKGRQPETVEQRKYMLKEWFNYVLDENGEYTPPMALLILDGVIKDLKPDNDTIPPVLNRGVLADVVDEIKLGADENKNLQVNFNKMYKMKLEEFYTKDFEDKGTGETKTGWIIIPSYENDPENFEDNVNKLKTLSYKTWCTKSFNAEPYLRKGDFHVYLEAGKPKLGVRFVGNEIAEIQGEKNNSRIPIAYLDEAESHLKNGGYKLSKSAKSEISSAQARQSTAARLSKHLKKIKAYGDTQKILKAFDIKTKVNSDGTLTISGYHSPCGDLTYDDLGISENEMFKNIAVIDGNADFENTDVTDLGALREITGGVSFRHSRVASLKNLETVGLYADFLYSPVRDLGKLRNVGLHILNNDYLNQNPELLENIKTNTIIKTIKEDLKEATENNDTKTIFNYFGIAVKENDDGTLTISEYHQPFIDKHCKMDSDTKPHLLSFRDLGINEDELFKNVRTIEGNADFSKTLLTTLWSLEEIGGNANFNETCISSLGNLRKIGKNADFSYMAVVDLGNLEEIGGNADFFFCRAESLGKLRKIGGNANFSASYIVDVSSLESVGGHICLRTSKLTKEDFKNLKPDNEFKKIFHLLKWRKKEPKFITD